MNEENEKKSPEAKGGSKVLWIVIGLVVIIAAAATWWFTKKDTKTTEDTAKTEQTTEKAPKHADWQKFTSSKYKFTMYYPADYTLTESPVGNVSLSKGSTVMVDLYVTVASTSGNEVTQSVAWYMDSTKGYMTGAAEVDTTVAGEKATMVTGILGSKAGIVPQAGKKGSTVFFVKNGNRFALDSFYNDNVADFQIFEDILADLRF